VEKLAHPARGSQGEILLVLNRKKRKAVGLIYLRFVFFSTAWRWLFTPRFFTVRLQPQMKKYRSLW